MECSLPGTSVHGILQARKLDFVAHSLLQEIFPWDWSQVSFTTGRFLTIWATREAPVFWAWCTSLFLLLILGKMGCPWWLGAEESACWCWKCGFDPWIRKIPWRMKWQPTPVFLPGKSHSVQHFVTYLSLLPISISILWCNWQLKPTHDPWPTWILLIPLYWDEIAHFNSIILEKEFS